MCFHLILPYCPVEQSKNTLFQSLDILLLTAAGSANHCLFLPTCTSVNTDGIIREMELYNIICSSTVAAGLHKCVNGKVNFGFHRFQSYGCVKAELWKTALPFRSPCVRSQITVTENQRNSLPVVCAIPRCTEPLSLNESVYTRRVGLAVNVSITQRKLKYSTLRVGCSQRDKVA